MEFISQAADGRTIAFLDAVDLVRLRGTPNDPDPIPMMLMQKMTELNPNYFWYVNSTGYFGLSYSIGCRTEVEPYHGARISIGRELAASARNEFWSLIATELPKYMLPLPDFAPVSETHMTFGTYRHEDGVEELFLYSVTDAAGQFHEVSRPTDAISAGIARRVLR